MKNKKQIVVCIALLLVIAIGTVVAMNGGPFAKHEGGDSSAPHTTSLSTIQRDEAMRIDVQDLLSGKIPEGMTGEKLLAVYEQRYRGMGDEGLLLLDTVHGLGLQATPDTAQAVLRLLRNAPTGKERAQLVKIYGALHHQTDDPSLRETIRKEIGSLARDNRDAEVVRAAVLTYSRLGYFADSLELLTRAQASGNISENDCYGDMAHLLPVAPARDQAEILSRLQIASNAYSREVLADYLSRPGVVQELSSESLGRAREILGSAEPVFEGSPFEFGMFDAIRYERWLSAMAGMADRGESGRSDFLADRLTRSGMDPRVLLAAFMTPEFAATVAPALSSVQIASVDNAIAAFAGKYPDSQMIQEAATTARHNLGRHR